MRGIRVFSVPHDVEEKHLKIYFSKKENNGGTIETIYYPLTNNDAVITFKGAEVVNRLLEIDHTLKSSPLKIQRLPEHTIFTSLEAKLSSDVSALIIATPDLQDQIRYVADIDIISAEAETQEGTANQTLCFRGNWFQLEWAWNMLACIMQQQQSNSINRPMEKSDVHNRSAEKHRRRQQHLGVDGFGKVEAGFIRPNQSDQVPGSKPKDSLGQNKRASYEAFVKTDTDDHKIVPESLTAGLTGKSKRNRRQDTKEIIQGKLTQQGDGKLKTRSAKLSHTADGLEQFDDPPRPLEQSMGLLSLSSQETRNHTQSEQMSYDGSRRLDNGFTKSHHDDIVEDKQRFQSLKENISACYESTDEPDTDDELRGVGYKIPSGSLSMAQTSKSKPYRYKDENNTLEKFSSLRSDLKVAEESSRRQNSEHSSAFSGAYGTENYKRGLSDSREDPYSSSLPVDLNDVKSYSHETNIDDLLKKYSYRNSESYTKHGLNSSLSPTDIAGMRPSRKDTAEARHSLYDSKFQHPRDDKERLGSSVTRAPLQSSYSTDELSFKTDIKGIQVAIYHGSLLEEDTGAIVNAANEQLEHYGGIAYAIAKARGPEINTECQKYIRKHGSLKKTEAMVTSGGGRIKADYIIHAAGPMWLSLWKETFHQELTRTFLNCFRLAEKLSLTSVAVPAISTGVYGAPLDECIKSFIDAVLLFSREQKRLTDIRMLNNDAENAATSIVLLKTILEAPIDQLMKHALASNSGDSHRDLNIPRGRQERSGSFSRTYSKLTDKAGTAKSSKSSTSYRLSSHSRLTDFAAKEDKHQPTSYELKKSGYSAEGMGVSPRDSHSTNRTEPRQYGPSSRSSQSSEIESHNVPYPTAEKATPRMKLKLKQ